MFSTVNVSTMCCLFKCYCLQTVNGKQYSLSTDCLQTVNGKQYSLSTDFLCDCLQIRLGYYLFYYYHYTVFRKTCYFCL